MSATKTIPTPAFDELRDSEPQFRRVEQEVRETQVGKFGSASKAKVHEALTERGLGHLSVSANTHERLLEALIEAEWRSTWAYAQETALRSKVRLEHHIIDYITDAPERLVRVRADFVAAIQAEYSADALANHLDALTATETLARRWASIGQLIDEGKTPIEAAEATAKDVAEEVLLLAGQAGRQSAVDAARLRATATWLRDLQERLDS